MFQELDAEAVPAQAAQAEHVGVHRQSPSAEAMLGSLTFDVGFMGLEDAAEGIKMPVSAGASPRVDAGKGGVSPASGDTTRRSSVPESWDTVPSSVQEASDDSAVVEDHSPLKNRRIHVVVLSCRDLAECTWFATQTPFVVAKVCDSATATKLATKRTEAGHEDTRRVQQSLLEAKPHGTNPSWTAAQGNTAHMTFEIDHRLAVSNLAITLEVWNQSETPTWSADFAIGTASVELAEGDQLTSQAARWYPVDTGGAIEACVYVDQFERPQTCID
jgi:hypothetical protein